MSIFPTSLTDKTTLVAWDKVLGYDSETPSNKNFSADAIANFAFTSKTSDNLSEWATNKYASTANVDAAWAVMNSDTSTAGMSFVIDEDNMVSDSATKVPTQQSVKAYVDAEIAGMSLPVADETTAWIVERATDAEALAGTDTTRYISSNSARLAFGTITPWSAFTYLEANTERTSSVDTYTKVKEFLVNKTGRFTVNFDLKASGSWSTINARIYINWVAVWTEQTSSTTYVTKSENFNVINMDLVQLYYKSNAWTHAIVRNFNMKYDLVSWVTAWTVNTD